MDKHSASIAPTGTRSTKPRHCLKIMSWNINHHRDKLEGAKSEIEEVQRLIFAQDIFCLQETKGQFTIRDFKCFNANRKGTSSGGLCTGIRKSLAAGANRVYVPECDDILIIKLKAKFFNLDKDLNLINVYDSPSHGSYKKRMKSNNDDFTSTRDHLEECLALIPASEDIVLLGDLNARTSTLNEVLTPCNFRDINVELEPPTSWDFSKLPRRNNQDKTLNANGKPFIELLQTTEMIILNGRTVGDIFGSPTCVQRNGISTVDYICVSPRLLQRVRYFKVGNLTPYSDHRPISSAINTNSTENLLQDCPTADLNFISAPRSFKWTKDEQSGLGTSELFKAAQNNDSFNQKLELLSNKVVSSPSDVNAFNDDVIATLTSLAESVTSQKSGVKRTNKNKWYDWDCRSAKRSVCQVERMKNKTKDDPMKSEYNRHKFYLRKKEYRAQIRAKRGEYLYKLNEKINGHKNVNWSALKDLSSTYKDPDTFDMYDLVAFHKFFNDLYSQKCQDPSHSLTPDAIRTSNDSDDWPDELGNLNMEFTREELDAAVNKLQKNKSVSMDLISNEMLKDSKDGLRSIFLKLFNSCLEYGTYPWNCSITTPLHKKGDKQNPDNYRAITVGSCLGKLYSSLLLARLIEFRKVVCPDPPNQLGFRVGAQCSDHILTLSTIIEKYTKNKKRNVFACFIDYRKAFDTVCREALMFKLNSLGFHGKFFSCIRSMYNNSKTRIKLVQKLSDTIDVTIGTEQGHPMSPELFKLYIYELSIRLDALSDIGVPLLNGFPVSHLLWADDLILLALDVISLQKQLNCLNEFVISWELSVNLGKTNIMVFNSSSRLLKCSYGFKLGDMDVTPVRKYCYLGIEFSLNGSFKHAINELRKKALKAFFSIKKMVDTRALTTSTMMKLIDSLVKPVATYACPIWLPSTNILKEMARNSKRQCNLARIAAKDSFETTHIKMLKWIIGVHKRRTTIFVTAILVGCHGLCQYSRNA